MATQRVGFLGLGVMGKQMAQRLLKQGTEVVVWNRSADKCAPLVALGATALATPAEVVDACSVTHGMLADPKASEAVCLGADGVASAAKVGKSYLDHSTIDEATGARLRRPSARRARARRARVRRLARRGRGRAALRLRRRQDAFDEVTAPARLAVMGSKHWHVGESSEARAGKIDAADHDGHLHRRARRDARARRQGGLDQAQIMDMFDSSAMANPISKAKGQHDRRRRPASDLSRDRETSSTS
ncbi:3-hydroxyisobutyrate dehydrogenase [Aureococcus anophagefferens]|nr:3-hydroxyisobutyrate dehydrogenase [Aureococcus anophagefferens]